MNDEPKIKVIAADSLEDFLRQLIGDRKEETAEQQNTSEQQAFADRMQEKLSAECNRLTASPTDTCVLFADTKDVHRAFHQISKGMYALLSHQDVLDSQKLGAVPETSEYKSIVKITIEYAGESDFGKREHQH